MNLSLIEWFQSISSPVLIILLLATVWLFLKVKGMVVRLFSLAFAFMSLVKFYLMFK